MNITTIKKHYDKLTAEERVSAMIAALGRDDFEEYKTLAHASPFGKTFRIREHHGLLDAWEWLGMWHVLMQLGELVSLYFVLFHEIDIDQFKINFHEDDGVETHTYTTDEAIILCVRRFLEGQQAWRAICTEHNLDSNDTLSRLPCVETIELNELTFTTFGKETGIEIDPSPTLQAYREAIRIKRAEWE